MDERRGLFAVLVGLAVVAFVLALAAVGVMSYLAYDTHSSRVSELEEKYDAQSRQLVELEETKEEIVQDHAEIGKAFAAASARLRRISGLVSGKSARLPPRLASLRRFARRGLLTPRALPRALATRRFSVVTYRDGYSVTWPAGVALFASSTRDRVVRALISKSSRRARTTVRIGRRPVTRIDGPLVIYAWTERKRAYTVLAPRRFDAVARSLIRRL